MKIRNIYLSKKFPVISIAIALLCIAVTVISAAIPSLVYSFSFTYPVRNPWQFITYIFEQYTPQEQIPPSMELDAARLSVGHLMYNLMLVIPFGILAEKVLGAKKFLILCIAAWIPDIAAIYITFAAITPEGEENVCKGASGIAFAFVPVVLYILFLMGKKYGFGKLFKQISFYFLMPMAVMSIVIALSPSVAGVTGIFSMILHLIAIVVGTVCTIVFRKTVRGYFELVNDVKIK